MTQAIGYVALLVRDYGEAIAYFTQCLHFHLLQDTPIDADKSARGVQFLEEPRREPYALVAVFRDLYGNRWDLLQPGPPPTAASDFPPPSPSR